MLFSRVGRIGWTAALSTIGLAIAASAGCTEPGISDDYYGRDMGPDLSGTVSMPSGPAPTLRSVAPDRAAAIGGAEVTLTGTDFRQGASVLIAGIPATNVKLVSATQLVATVPTYTGPLGFVDITVRNSDGSKVSHNDFFSYVRVPISFTQTLTRAVGTKPAALAAGDLDGDSKPDLIVANQGSNNITLLLSNQSFQSVAGPYDTASTPSALATGDINGDGITDVLVGCSNSSMNDLGILLGNGAGAINQVVNFAVGQTVTGLVTGDFDGDGKNDIAASSRTLGKVYVLKNASSVASLSFAAPTSYDLGANAQPNAVFLADLNKDGKRDLITANAVTNQLATLLGQSGGTFMVPAKTATVGTEPIALAAADLNGDGNPDVIVANFQNGSLSLLKGQGDGTFASSATVQTATQPSAVALADMDKDGKLDLIVANAGQNQINVMPGKGDGTFEPMQTFFVGTQPMSMVVVDLNGDGRPDVATANMAANSVSILYNSTN